MYGKGDSLVDKPLGSKDPQESYQNYLKMKQDQEFKPIKELVEQVKFNESLKKDKEKKEEEKKYPPIPVDDPGFELFCKYFSYPAYSGLYEWQKRHHKLTWEAKFEKTLVHRKAGKSVLYNNKYQWAIQYQNFDVLLLGWTARYKEIAVYVYNFFEFYGLVEQDKRTSPFHFRTKNGGRFDCYLITSKETLGLHSEGLQDRFDNISESDWEEYKSLFKGNFEKDENLSFSEKELREYVESRKGTERKLWIAIDDPIDMSFRKERHKEETLELHFNSTLYGIQPDKWSFTGTRKFEGDFFDFVDVKFGDRLVSYVRGIWEDYDKRELLCPEAFTHPDVDTYEEDLKAGKEDLAFVQQDVGPYVWSSDFLQQPHPEEGSVWSCIGSIPFLDEPLNRYYDVLWITIDRATTRKAEAERKKADYTGCVIGVREIQTGKLIITHDYTDYIDIDELLLKINKFVSLFNKKYPIRHIVLIVETQGGGSDFVTLAKNSREFLDVDGSYVLNEIPTLTIIEEVHNTGDKEQRIRDRLNAPIRNERILVVDTLLQSKVVLQILNFPFGDKVDAVDALANAQFVILEKYPLTESGNPYEEMAKVFRKHTENQERKVLKGEVEEFVFEIPVDLELERIKADLRKKNRGIFD